MGKSYEEIHVGATVFGNAAKTLGVIGEAGQKQLDKNTGSAVLAQNMIPSIVLMAFSCELHLKALVVKSGKNYGRIHDLDALYALLDEQTKSAIKDLTVSRIQTSSPGYNDTDFKQDLQETAKAFEDWRYFYEEKQRKVNYLFLNSFFEVLATYQAA